MSELHGPVDQASDLRPYVLTGGRTAVPDHELPVEALVLARPGIGDPVAAEERAIVAATRDAYLSVAEIAATVRLPLGVVRVLVADLAIGGHLTVAGTGSAQRRQPRHLLEEVLDGIDRL